MITNISVTYFSILCDLETCSPKCIFEVQKKKVIKVFYQFDMLQCYEKINVSISNETKSELQVLSLNRLDHSEPTFRPLTILNFRYSNPSMILVVEHSQSNSMNMYSIFHIFPLDRVRLRQCSLPIARTATPRMSSPRHLHTPRTTRQLLR